MIFEYDENSDICSDEPKAISSIILIFFVNIYKYEFQEKNNIGSKIIKKFIFLLKKFVIINLF